MTTEDHIVQAAGRMLSQDSARSIKTAWRELALLLIEAKEILPGQISPDLLQPEQDVEASQQGRGPDREDFGSLPTAPDGEEDDSSQESSKDGSSRNNSEQDSNEEVAPASETVAGNNSETVSASNNTTEDKEVAPASETVADNNTTTSSEERFDCDKLQLEFAVSARAHSDMASPYTATNERAIEGVLFQTDAVSEGSPNVGPGMPLYIPRHVAEAAVQEINNSQLPKPLDAHDSLSQHANTEIVGAIVNARLDGNDFVVRGILWDANQPRKVQSILAAKDQLGMSVNATVKGHPERLTNGRSVFWIDTIRVLGANILFADRATYRGTRIINASQEKDDRLEQETPIDKDTETPKDRETQDNMPSSPPPKEMELAASDRNSESEPGQQGEQEMNPKQLEFIQAQLEQISSSINEMSDYFDSKLSDLRSETAHIDSRVQNIEAERQQQEEQVQAQAQQKQQQEERESLLNEVREVVKETMESASKGRRGSNPPQRRTVPLAASSSEQSAESSETAKVQQQIARIDGALEEMEQSNYPTDFTRMIELQEERRYLQSQLQ